MAALALLAALAAVRSPLNAGPLYIVGKGGEAGAAIVGMRGTPFANFDLRFSVSRLACGGYGMTAEICDFCDVET